MLYNIPRSLFPCIIRTADIFIAIAPKVGEFTKLTLNKDSIPKSHINPNSPFVNSINTQVWMIEYIYWSTPAVPIPGLNHHNIILHVAANYLLWVKFLQLCVNCHIEQLHATPYLHGSNFLIWNPNVKNLLPAIPHNKWNDNMPKCIYLGISWKF